MNVKVIIFIVIIIAIIGAGYSISKFTKKSSDDNGGSAKKAPGQPDVCGGQLFPSIKCDSDLVICDPKINRWRCKLPCETETNPFPLNFVNCRISDIKCDGNGDYYCGDNYCQNGGVLYNNPDKKCSCPIGYTGLKCDIPTSQCHMGNFNSIDQAKCDTCCDKDTSIQGKCRYYNGPKQQCENDCESELKNSVFDTDNNKCVCPKYFEQKDNVCYAIPTICNPDGTEKDENGKNIIGDNGLCKCKSGWEGALCNIKKCQNGTYNTNTLKCDCDKGFVGNRCQYSSQNSCNGHGNPKVNEQGVFTICECDPDYDGQRCSCKKSDRAEDDNCSGLYQQCTDQGWKTTNSSCQDIYSKFGDENSWRSSCSKSLLSSDDYNNGYIPICNENASPGSKNQITSQRTCASNPSNDDLKDCLDDGAYIPWTDPEFKANKNTAFKIPDNTTKVCVCESVRTKDGLVPKYSVRNVSSQQTCGPVPPLGFCKVGTDTHMIDVEPICLAPYGESGERAWVCPGQIVPKNLAEDIWDVRKHSISGSQKYWYSTNTGTDSTNLTVYPVMNMEKCDSRPYDILTSGTTNIKSGYNSFSSEAGFVDSLIPTNPTYTPTYTSLEDAKKINSGLLLFNRRIDQDTTVGGQKFSDFSKSVKFQDRIGKKIVGDVKLGDYSIDRFMISENANCAKKTNVNDYSKCQNGGRSVQICADKDYNIVDCNYDTPMYRYDKVLCNCYGGPDPSTTGDRCQYTNKDTCNENGLVDYNGKCNCYDGYAGDHCQYSDSVTCQNIGKAQNDGSCICKGKNRNANCLCKNDTSYSIKFGDDCYSSLLTTLDINNNLIISPGSKYYMKLNSKIISGKTAIDNVVISKIDDSSPRVIFTNNDPNCSSISGYINDKSVPFWFAYEWGINTNTGSSIYSGFWPPPDLNHESSDVPYFRGSKIILEDDGRLNFIVYADDTSFSAAYL